MGNIRPKLSAAMRRELDVRRQLGVRATFSKAKGRIGAKRAEQELQRRIVHKRRCSTGWNDLCFELQDMILHHLPLVDLLNVRLAGLGAESIASKKRTRDMMVRRCQQLQPLWKIWTRGTSNHQTKSERITYKPIQFSCTVRRLSVLPDAGGIPDSVCEMVALEKLDVSRPHNHAYLGLPAALTTLPASLSACYNLTELKMSYQNFETIPECVLNLRNLRRIEIESNRMLKQLPEDIGDRILKLRFINIRGCEKLKTLPESLLRRLEANAGCRQVSRIPLLLTTEHFPDGYLMSTISSERYPKLVERLQRIHVGIFAPQHNNDFLDPEEF